MKPLKIISISLVTFATLLTCKCASAVPVPPIFVPPPVRDFCGGYSDSWSASCSRDDNGNMIDGRTGDVYDSGGNQCLL